MHEGSPAEDPCASPSLTLTRAADPTADVEGHDVQAKIALVAKLAFGVSVPLDQIQTKGISSITRCSSVPFPHLVDDVR